MERSRVRPCIRWRRGAWRSRQVRLAQTFAAEVGVALPGRIRLPAVARRLKSITSSVTITVISLQGEVAALLEEGGVGAVGVAEPFWRTSGPAAGESIRKRTCSQHTRELAPRPQQLGDVLEPGAGVMLPGGLSGPEREPSPTLEHVPGDGLAESRVQAREEVGPGNDDMDVVNDRAPAGVSRARRGHDDVPEPAAGWVRREAVAPKNVVVLGTSCRRESRSTFGLHDRRGRGDRNRQTSARCVPRTDRSPATKGAAAAGKSKHGQASAGAPRIRCHIGLMPAPQIPRPAVRPAPRPASSSTSALARQYT